jgi:hypothetical protein
MLWNSRERYPREIYGFRIYVWRQLVGSVTRERERVQHEDASQDVHALPSFHTHFLRAIDTCHGMAYLEKNHVIHRDLGNEFIIEILI